MRSRHVYMTVGLRELPTTTTAHDHGQLLPMHVASQWGWPGCEVQIATLACIQGLGLGQQSLARAEVVIPPGQS